MVVILLPIVTLMRLVQFRNAKSPIVVAFVPIVTLVALVQDWKTSYPMLLTFVGTMMLVRLSMSRYGNGSMITP